MSARFCRLVREYIGDERKAGKRDYPTLRRVAPKGAKAVISGIQGQENSHHGKLIKLNRRYCGGK